jgi:hypothetical protein
LVVFFNPYNSKSSGPAIHAYEFISHVRKLYNNQIIEIKFSDKETSFFDANEINLILNNRIWTFIYSVFLLLPKESAKYFSFKNVNILRKFISKNPELQIYFFGFAKTGLYVKFIDAKRSIITLPDAQSMRYVQYLKKNFSIKIFLQLLFYKLLERRTLMHFDLIHVVAKKDAEYLTKFCVKYLPFHLSKKLICNVNKAEGSIIFLSPLNVELLDQIIPALLLNNKITKICIHDNLKVIKNQKYKNEKVNIVNWIQDYENFTSSFQVIVVDDPVDSTGMSTRVTHQIYSGNIVLGNKIAFRNLDSIFYEYVYDCNSTLLFKINEIVEDRKMRPGNYLINNLFNLMNFNKIFISQNNFFKN